MKLDKLLAPQLFYFKERFLCPPSNTQYTRTRHKIGFKHISIVLTLKTVAHSDMILTECPVKLLRTLVSRLQR